MNIAKHFCGRLNPHQSRLTGHNGLAVVGEQLKSIRPLLTHQHLYRIPAPGLARQMCTVTGMIKNPIQELMQGLSVEFPVPAHVAHVSECACTPCSCSIITSLFVTSAESQGHLSRRSAFADCSHIAILYAEAMTKFAIR